MYQELKRVIYSCDHCGERVEMDQSSGEFALLPKGWRVFRCSVRTLSFQDEELAGQVRVEYEAEQMQRTQLREFHVCSGECLEQSVGAWVVRVA